MALMPSVSDSTSADSAHTHRLYAGTSGWSYPSWKPQFYPAKLPAKKFLEHYATRLNSVEVNYTFRQLASEKLQQGWLDATPPGFLFSVKAHQMITHIKRLRDAADFTQRFLASLQPLSGAGKLGTVLFQLPPFLKCDTALLGDFLGVLPTTLRKTFEFRHESWFTDAVFDLLRAHNSALCIAESEKLTVPEVHTAGFSYFRLRNPEYTPAERAELAKKFAALRAKASDVFVYFKHEETPEGAMHAEEMLQSSR